MRKLITAAAVVVAGLAVVPATFAANPHFVTGVAEPTCELVGTTVNCTGTEIAGVGNNNAQAVLTVHASGTVDCNNPGENPNNPIESHETTFTTEAATPIIEPKNGRLVIPPLSATAPSTLTPEQEAELCPNPNWEADLRDVEVTSWTYVINFLTRDGVEEFFRLEG